MSAVVSPSPLCRREAYAVVLVMQLRPVLEGVWDRMFAGPWVAGSQAGDLGSYGALLDVRSHDGRFLTEFKL